MSPRLLRFASLAAALLFGTGCTVYQPRPVTFDVRDGDTGLPVAGVQVSAAYLTLLDFGVPFASIGPRGGVTDQDGKLSLVVDTHHDRFVCVVSSDRYEKEGTRQCWHRHMPVPWYAFRDDYQIRLFHGPPPTADVTLPPDYRGVVVVKFADCDQPPLVKGQRTFTYTGSARGVVNIAEGAFFEKMGSFDGIRARRGNGPVLPTVVKNTFDPPPTTPVADEVALRFITPDWQRHVWLYVLGTAAEADAIERTVWLDNGNRFDDAAFKRIVEGR